MYYKHKPMSKLISLCQNQLFEKSTVQKRSSTMCSNEDF